MKLKLVIMLCVVMVFLQVLPVAVGGATNVLVVQNRNSEVSCRIAEYYMSKRNIDPGNLVTVSAPDSSKSRENEIISLQDYRDQIERPITLYLTEHKLTDTVQYIVLTKGIPHRLGNGAHGESVDSLLATIDLKDPIQIHLRGADGNSAGDPYVNRYWRSKEPFFHAKFGGYLVTRLDGYTEADAKALVDRAIAAPRQPCRIFLDVYDSKGLGDVSVQPRSMLHPNGSPDTSYKMGYDDFNADMIHAADILQGRPKLSIEIEKTKEFVAPKDELTCYFSWGSNDGSFSKVTYHALRFGPRSIVETAVSTSGRTFVLNPESKGQSLICDLIAQGAAGAKCYVTEPYIHAMASSSVLLDLYSSGRNLAESYYAASRFLGWKDVVIGDPLCTLEKEPIER